MSWLNDLITWQRGRGACMLPVLYDHLLLLDLLLVVLNRLLIVNLNRLSVNLLLLMVLLLLLEGLLNRELNDD